MGKYLFLYHAPAQPDDAPQMSEEDMQAEMGKWMAWGGEVGDQMVDFGSPLAGGTRVTGDGAQPSTRDVSGYTILEADDMDGALSFAHGHPHLAMPGAEIEVHEMQPIPGM